MSARYKTLALRFCRHALRYRSLVRDYSAMLVTVGETADMWKARAGKAEAELAGIRDENFAMKMTLTSGGGRLSSGARIWLDMKAKRDRLRELLRDADKEGYIYHAGYCPYVDLKPKPCTCGLTAWRERVRAEFDDRRAT